jgi:hypothetical protein
MKTIKVSKRAVDIFLYLHIKEISFERAEIRPKNEATSASV